MKIIYSMCFLMATLLKNGKKGLPTNIKNKQTKMCISIYIVAMAWKYPTSSVPKCEKISALAVASELSCPDGVLAMPAYLSAGLAAITRLGEEPVASWAFCDWGHTSIVWTPHCGPFRSVGRRLSRPLPRSPGARGACDWEACQQPT